MQKRLVWIAITASLASCAQQPISPNADVKLTLNGTLSGVQRVTVSVSGPESRTLEAKVDGGRYTVDLKGLKKGTYTVTARAWDGPTDNDIVLYRAQGQMDLEGGTRSLTFERAKGKVNLEVEGLDETNTLKTYLGNNPQPLSLGAAKLSATAKNLAFDLETGRNLVLRLEEVDASGKVVARATSNAFNLSDGGTTLRLTLQDLPPENEIQDPTAPLISGPQNPRAGSESEYTFTLEDPNASEAVTLKALEVAWGDGSTSTEVLSGKSQTVKLKHTWVTEGTRTLTAKVFNSEGRSAQAQYTVKVSTTPNPDPDTLPAVPVITGADSVQATEPYSLQVDVSSPVALKELEVNWDDGTAPEIIPLEGLQASKTLSHTYAAGQVGTRTIRVTVRNTQNQENSGTKAITVNAAPIDCPAPTGTVRNIGEIQGTGATSPLVNERVMVRGVVTANHQAGLSGFFIQEIAPDGNEETSDGLFVYTASAPLAVEVGQIVQLSGVVNEYKGNSDALPGTSTQLTSISDFAKCNGTLNVTPVEINLPLNGPEQLEKYENMLVTFPQALTVTEVYQLGQFGTVALSVGGRQYHPNNGNVPASREENLRRRILLDDASNKQNPNPIPYLSGEGDNRTRRIGDVATGVTGVLGYSFDAFRVQPTQPVAFQEGDSPRTVAPEAVNGRLKVASFNVLNYFTTFGSRGARNDTEFQRQRTKIIEALYAIDADVVGLIEMENNGGVAVQNLVDGLNAKYGNAPYTYVQTGVTKPQGASGDVITNAIIYKKTAVKPVGTPWIDTNPVHNRPVVGQTFQEIEGSGVFTLLVNHFKSKRCDGNPTGGDAETDEGCYSATRVQQAQALLNFIGKVQAESGDNDVLAMGDFNAYELEAPIKALRGTLTGLDLRVPATDRYSYVYDGESGYLDHAMGTSSIVASVTGVTQWHINSNEPRALQYTNSRYSSDNTYAPTPYASSDHDPIIVGLNLQPDPVRSAAPRVVLSGDANVLQNTAYALGIEVQPDTGRTITDLKVKWTAQAAFETLAPNTTSATRTYTEPGNYTITVQATDDAGRTGESTKTVTVTSSGGGSGADLFFSEYIEGSSSNKALEIYNPTASSVDLNGYRVELYTNGSTSVQNALNLSGTLPAGGTVVIYNSSFTATSKDKGSVNVDSNVTFFNGDDALVLKKNDVIIDRIGRVGERPNGAWTGGGLSTQDRTLRRKASVTQGDPNATATFDPSVEWDGYPIDSVDNLGQR
ncbi:hypothetical protein HNR42_000060 [Deinobacterium chartae]|uniref:LTD domain-containing protein n=1 Tax=Deinobacterium chartae TaxID=521158 RepID=A0A841HXL3_9DEIO|nr:ExeM/NucH family extracellular endonuclease [Deinobacterium chartae]MBB6096648.1 hypothetical protein [Deinobacterium chartae]